MKEISESTYKPDFEIMDRYINFSSELLRLSLLGITGMGTLLLLQIRDKTPITFSDPAKTGMFLAVIVWSIGAGFALAHRFFATDCMSYHVKYLRLDEQDKNERRGRNKLLKRSGRCLILAEVCFGLGVLAFVLSVFSIFFK